MALDQQIGRPEDVSSLGRRSATSGAFLTPPYALSSRVPDAF